jgi:NitT/TauT family transport system substrate-binding protein
MWRALYFGALLLGLTACATPAAPAPVAPIAPASAPAAAANPAPAAAAPAAPPPLVTVKVAEVTTLSGAAALLAVERGYFADEGIEIEMTRVDGAAQTIPHLTTGQLDAANITPSSSFFNAVNRGLPLRIVGAGGRQSPGQASGAWVLREDLAARGTVRDWADLRGLTIGMNVPNTGSYPDIVLDRTLDRAGLTRDDVQIVGLGFPDINTAFASKTIDAANHTEPYISLGENMGLLRRWRSVAEVVPDQHSGVWLYGPAFGETEAAYRFMVAYLRGARDYNDAFAYGRDKAAVVDVLTRLTTVKDPHLFDQMSFINLDPDGRIIPERIADDMQYYVSHGYTQQPVDVAQVIDMRYVDYALARLGPYKPPTP